MIRVLTWIAGCPLVPRRLRFDAMSVAALLILRLSISKGTTRP